MYHKDNEVIIVSLISIGILISCFFIVDCSSGERINKSCFIVEKVYTPPRKETYRDVQTVHVEDVIVEIPVQKTRTIPAKYEIIVQTDQGYEMISVTRKKYKQITKDCMAKFSYLEGYITGFKYFKDVSFCEVEKPQGVE